MNEELNMIFSMARESMEASYEHLGTELTKIRAGKASPSMLSPVKVDYYGTETPLNQVANVNTTDARTLVVQPWEKSLLEDISTAITNANLGLNPQNNGEMIIISVPVLTEERRKDLSKQVHAEGENAKVSVRSARKDAMDEIKRLEKDGLSEDMSKDAQDEVQNIVNAYNAKIEKLVEAKEADIMTV
ncbi:MAG: ribosome recycling factor [Flavobacteriales bacterium]|nr:ribosome recycling factor [Flavobacteriales bacterium]